MSFKFVGNILWRIFFEINKSLYLYLPRWLGGEENINQIDLCSRALNINSALFLSESGWTICDEYLQNKLTGRTTLSIVLLLATLLWICFILFWYTKVKVPPVKETMSTVNNVYIYHVSPWKKKQGVRELLKDYKDKFKHVSSPSKIIKWVKKVKS